MVVSRRAFAQVDVFSPVPYRGNPLAVVLDARGIDDTDMARFAAWTNLSETTFVLPPDDDTADYRVRIFTPGTELPFAGHPTLGTAHAWLEAGGVPRTSGLVVQECGIGLVPLRRTTAGLAFQAPPRVRSGPLDEDTVERVAHALRIPRSAIVDAAWADNGPGWMAVLLGSAAEVLALEPDHAALSDVAVGVVGPYPPGARARLEVRAFAGRVGVREDAVTGSLHAGLAQWLLESGRVDGSYVAGQGARLGRDGLVVVDVVEGDVWVGGASVTCIWGEVLL